MPLCDLPDVAKHPFELYDAQKSFRQAIQDSMGSWRIENVDAVTDVGVEFLQAVEKVKDHEFFKSLPWKETADAAKAAASKIDAYEEAVKHWSLPLDVKSRKHELEELTKAFDLQFADLKQYYATVQGIVEDGQQASAQQKADVTDLCNKLYGQLGRLQVPKGPAKVLATAVYEFDTQSFELQKKAFSRPQNTLQEGGDERLEDKRKHVFVFDTAGACGGSFQESVSLAFAESAASINETADKCEVKIGGHGPDGKKHPGCCTSVGVKLSWPSGMHAKDVQYGVLRYMEVGHCSLSPDMWSLQGMGGVFQVVRGTVAMWTISPSLIGSEKDLAGLVVAKPDRKIWQTESTAIILGPNQCVHIPFGFGCGMLGLPVERATTLKAREEREVAAAMALSKGTKKQAPQKKKKKAEGPEYACVLFYPCMSEDDASASAELTSWVSSQLSGNRAYIPSKLQNSPDYKSWLAKLSQAAQSCQGLPDVDSDKS